VGPERPSSQPDNPDAVVRRIHEEQSQGDETGHRVEDVSVFVGDRRESEKRVVFNPIKMSQVAILCLKSN
jgi:hypothetical protein